MENEEKKTGKGMKTFKTIIILVLLAACLIGGYGAGKGWFNKQEEKPIVIVDWGFDEIGELATEEFYCTEVKDFSDSKMIGNVKIPFTTKKLICSYSGSIKAGIDFAQIRIDVLEAEKLINIQMPKARVLSIALDNDSYQVLDEKSSIFNQIKSEDINALQQEMKDAMEAKAIEKGLLSKAESQAELLVRNMILGMGTFNDYSLRFRW